MEQSCCNSPELSHNNLCMWESKFFSCLSYSYLGFLFLTSYPNSIHLDHDREEPKPNENIWSKPNNLDSQQSISPGYRRLHVKGAWIHIHVVWLLQFWGSLGAVCGADLGFLTNILIFLLYKLAKYFHIIAYNAGDNLWSICYWIHLIWSIPLEFFQLQTQPSLVCLSLY